MRHFVALHIPDDVREKIAKLIRELRPLDNEWKWPRVENLHVTLKFLGETPPDKLKNACDALRNISSEWPIQIAFRGLGFFPNERRPRVLWIGMDAPPAISKLAAGIEDGLAGVGVPREERAFTPHLTLARNKDGQLAGELRSALAKYSSLQFGTMNATAFHLVESKLKSTGAEYTTLESFYGASRN